MSSVLPLAEILSAANSNVGTEFTPALVDAIQKLSTHPERGRLRIELAGNLPLIKSPTGAGLLAVWYGAGVEHGAKPSDSFAAVLQTFLRWSRTISSDETQAPSDETIAGLQLLGQSLVAHLRHDANLVKELAIQPATISELERVEGASVGAAWVMQLVRIRSGIWWSCIRKRVPVCSRRMRTSATIFTCSHCCKERSPPRCRAAECPTNVC